MIFERSYQSLFAACQELTRRRERLAKPVLSGLLLPRVDPEVSTESLFSHLLAEALLRRLDRSLVTAKNIYLEKFDVSQIELFYLMTNAYPHVREGHRLANHYLLSELRTLPSATLVEIGIGRGLQVEELVKELVLDPGKLRTLDIVALDPDPRNLNQAEARLAALQTTGFRLQVHRYEGLIENVSREQLSAIAKNAGDNIVVNAAYTFHHTIHPLQANEVRTEILSRLNEHLRPRLFTLVEPSADHDTEHLVKRFHSCWEHFGNVFDLIDRADLDAPSKFVIKETFFGREIRDIFGTADHFRCERHERYESWMLRLTKAGLSPYELPVQPPITLRPHCATTVSEGLIRLGYGEQTLIAVLAYKSNLTPRG